MKRYFITGIVIILPLALTFLILSFIVNLFTAPFVGVVSQILAKFQFLEHGFLFLGPEQTIRYLSQFLIIFVLFAATVGIGALTSWVVVHYFIRLGDYIFHRIPIVRSVYKTSQDVIKTIFTTDTGSFKQVVLVPFPNKDVKSLGLVTREQIKDPSGEGQKVAVFVPTTPNPTSGFLMLFNLSDITLLDMKVEDAFKYIISCGVIETDLKKRDD